MIHSWHKPHHKPLKLPFHPQKGASKLKNSPYFKHKRLYINHLAWFDPEQSMILQPIVLSPTDS